MLVDTVVFAVAATLMLGGTLGFLLFYDRAGESFVYTLVPMSITGIAGLSYAAMAASSAGYLGDVVLQLRYLDWLLTTPLIVYYLALVAGGDARVKAFVVAADAVMIATGYAATVTTGALSLLGFAASSLAFLALVYVLIRTLGEAATDRPPAVRSMYLNLRDLTVYLWCLYPVVWLLSPAGVGLVAAADYHIVIATMDTSAKVGFNAIIAVRASGLASVTDADTPSVSTAGLRQ